jgi:hypothetical protein
MPTPVPHMPCRAAEQPQAFGGSPPTGDDEAYRRALRAVLASQMGLDRAQELRQKLLCAFVPASSIVWVLAVWPDGLPVAVRSTLLGVWWLLFTAILYAGFVELLWLRRSNAARCELRAMARPQARRDRPASRG